MNQDNFKKLISGQKTGLGAGLLRLLLGIASGGYSIAIRYYNFLYSKGWLKAYHVDATVICVGNITVGGTGKTPLVIWLCKEMHKRPKTTGMSRRFLPKVVRRSKSLSIRTVLQERVKPLTSLARKC